MSLTSLQEFRANTHNEDHLKASVSGVLKEFGFSPPLQAAESQSSLQFTHTDGSHVLVRAQPPNLITLDLHKDSKDVEVFQKFAEDIHERILKKLDCKTSQCLPAIQRGFSVPVYFPTADKRLVQYDFSDVVFEQDTPYQNVKIMKSQQYGNVLLLDNDTNLAESDLAYTHAITGHGRENYRDKTVLVLGGGDGGILHELRKEQPKFITMVDHIDEVVVEQARKLLRGICYDSLDQLKGQNYEVLIADCVPILKQYIEEGRVFDFVINDLTAIPCSTEPVGDHWDFLRLILDLSMQVLAPSGKYYTQGNGANMVTALDMYEKQLAKLKTPVGFNKYPVCVPSYLEMWVFYEIWKKGDDAKDEAAS